MGKPRLFSTVPARAIADDRLSGLDWRVLAGVSIRDGMSLVKGKGAGCYASNVTLAADVGCEYSSLSKSLARLLEYGYLKMERQADDKRMTTYRVHFEAPDSWPSHQASTSEAVGGTANQPQKVIGRNAASSAKVVGRDFPASGGKQPQTASHYIPLKGELDSVETEELNSSEEAHLTARSLPGRSESEAVGAWLAQIERAWKGEEGSVTLRQSTDAELAELNRNLSEIFEDHCGEPAGYQAERLLERIDLVCWENHRGTYAAGAAA